MGWGLGLFGTWIYGVLTRVFIRTALSDGSRWIEALHSKRVLGGLIRLFRGERYTLSAVALVV